MADRLTKGGVPLIYQLSEIFRSKIASGELQPNDPFPTEEQIVAAYGVSRTTVRLALAKLVNEGFIRRKQGVGSFVNPKGMARPDESEPMPRDMYDVKSTTNILQSAGKTVTSRLLNYSVAAGPERLSEMLDVATDDLLIHFERVRLANGSPVVVEKIWIPRAICPDLTAEDVHGSVYKVLSERYRLNVTAAHQALRATVADDELAALLAVPVGFPLMLVSGVSYTDEGQAVEVEESYFRSDKMEFIIELGRLSTYARLIK